MTTADKTQRIADLYPILEQRVRRAVAARLRRDSDDPSVQDACSEAWTTALRAAGAPLHDPHHMAGWLTVTGTRAYLQAYKRTQREHASLLGSVTDDHRHPAPSAEQEALHRAQLAAVAALEHRRALTMQALAAGYTYKEIARALARSPARVNHYVQEARRKLRPDWTDS